ncbi:MAG: RelA/SpoT family protein [Candidatus Cryptobacteroides sp.]
MYRVDDFFGKYSDEGKTLIGRAMSIAEEKLKDKVRENGHPFLEHPLNVARIVCDEIGLQAECVAAVFLHEAGRFDEMKMQLDGFPRDVVAMVEGLDKIAAVKPKDTRLEAENYKKLIVSYSRDPRVTVIKLADRLEIMRNLGMFPKSSRERKNLETLFLYIPLAHQLGLYNMKSEMEDIYFRYADPEQYRTITNKLKATEKDRQKLMIQFIEPLKQRLSDEGIQYKLKVRTKTAWSIYNKMRKQKVPFEGVFDVFAIRFIIDCPADPDTEKALCWKVFGYVTEEYEQDTNRLRDWLTIPKPNGYESLHITVKNRDGAYIEVQIRTKRMDETAESGLASHWSYKGISHEATLDNWLKSVRNILEHPANGASPYEDDLPTPPENEIFVFTPSGELRKLPSGATVLDFAFDIHSNLGIKCTGGRVNGKGVSIREKLNTGDIVEILSSKNQKPSPDWLNIVVSSKAKTKIRQKLSEIEFAKADEGKELLGRKLKNWKIDLSDDILATLLKKYQHKTLRSFYAAIGEGDIDLLELRDLITENPSKPQAEEVKIKTSLGEKDKVDDILVLNAKNVRGIDYKMAKCCNPVFGDDVFGFVSRLEGIKIHRISCPNAARLMEQYPYRIQKVRWSDNPSSSNFQVTLRITALPDPAVINEIMDVVNSFRSAMRGFSFNVNSRTGRYEIVMKLAVPGNLELDKILSQIRALKNVDKANRS